MERRCSAFSQGPAAPSATVFHSLHHMPAPSLNAARRDPGRWQLGDERLPSPLGGALTATDVTRFAPAACMALLCGPLSETRACCQS